MPRAKKAEEDPLAVVLDHQGKNLALPRFNRKGEFTVPLVLAE